MKKVVFLGSPDFAAEIFSYLLQRDDLAVIALVCQADKKVGRHQEIQITPTKKLALARQIPVFQPVKISDDFQELINLPFDLIISCAYGQFLPQQLLDRGVMNIHASLLPKYRGGAPIQRALMAGEKESGISLMQTVMKMDAGPVYCQKALPIDINDTYSSLQTRLIDCAKALLADKLEAILKGELKPLEQDAEQVSFAPIIKAKDELIDFQRPALLVYNQIRALIATPVGHGLIKGKKIKFHEAKLINETKPGKAGEILGLVADGLEIACQSGSVAISCLQPEGKQKMGAKEFFNGQGKDLVGWLFNEA